MLCIHPSSISWFNTSRLSVVSNTVAIVTVARSTVIRLNICGDTISRENSSRVTIDRDVVAMNIVLG